MPLFFLIAIGAGAISLGAATADVVEGGAVLAATFAPEMPDRQVAGDLAEKAGQFRRFAELSGSQFLDRQAKDLLVEVVCERSLASRAAQDRGHAGSVATRHLGLGGTIATLDSQRDSRGFRVHFRHSPWCTKPAQK